MPPICCNDSWPQQSMVISSAHHIPNLSPLLQPLENTIALKFIPSLTGRKDCSEIERELFALPARLGGLGLSNPTVSAVQQHVHLLHLHHFSPNNCHFQPKHNLHFHHLQWPTESKTVNPPYQPSTDQHNCWALKIKNEQPASSRCNPCKWKGRLLLANSPTHWWTRLCTHAQRRFQRCSFSPILNWHAAYKSTHQMHLQQAFFCRSCSVLPYWWFPFHQTQPTKRYLTAEALTEVCSDVCVEPHLQPLSGESLRYSSAIKEDGARLDIRANGFWGNRFQQAFFDIRVFNPNASSYRQLQPTTAYNRQEQLKRRHYEQRVREVEHGSFTPLVFSTSGGLSKAAEVTYKRLASLIAEKRDTDYTPQPASGLGTKFPSRCSGLPSPASVELALPVTLPTMIYHLHVI